MSRPQPFRRLEATVLDATSDGLHLRVRFALARGSPQQLEDEISLGPRGDLDAVHGVGRLLRILRAARIRAPEDPYALMDTPEEAAALIQRCRGTRIWLHVRRRIRRVLSVWTESGVDRIVGIIDFGEDANGLWVRRSGGQSLLQIPRTSLVRYSSASESTLEIVSVEVPSRSRLH